MKLPGLYLSRLFSLGIGIFFLILPALLISAEQKEFKVTGVVLSVDDLPLSGVNVIIKGTADGTVTDHQGNFSLTVPDNSPIIYFSHLGYRAKEIAISKPQTLTIRLTKDPIGSAIIRTQNESRWDNYLDLMEKAQKDMKSQIEPDWEKFWGLMEKAQKDMESQIEPDWEKFWDLMKKAQKDMRNQVNPN